MLTEIYQQPQPVSCSLQIVVNLCMVFIAKFLQRLDFNNHLFKAGKVRNIFVFKHLPLISQFEWNLGFERNRLIRKLNSQALLIHRLKEPAAQGVVHLKASANNFVALFLQDNFNHIQPLSYLFVSFVLFVVHFFFFPVTAFTHANRSPNLP